MTPRLGVVSEDSAIFHTVTHKKRTTKKPALSCVTPIKVATIPQATVRVGSQNFGVVLFNMMLHGWQIR